MVPVILALAIGTFAYLYWRRATTTLTRNCRWRQERSTGCWRCAFCGAELRQGKEPMVCLHDKAG